MLIKKIPSHFCGVIKYSDETARLLYTAPQTHTRTLRHNFFFKAMGRKLRTGRKWRGFETISCIMQLGLSNVKIRPGPTNSAERFQSDLIYSLPTCFTSCKRRYISRTSIKPGLCGSKQRRVFWERSCSKQTQRTEELRTNIIMTPDLEAANRTRHGIRIRKTAFSKRLQRHVAYVYLRVSCVSDYNFTKHGKKKY